MAVQETQGLLSPYLRNLRLRQVARHVAAGARVLDLACGAGYLATELPESCEYYGVDRIEVDRTSLSQRGAHTRQFFVQDLEAAGTVARIADWLPGRVDVITMAAFVEHLKDPASLIERFLPLLSSCGSIVGTTPHPIGRGIHEALARIGLCSREGANEHETFLGRRALEAVADSVRPLRLNHYGRFLLGLNQCFVYNVCDEPEHEAELRRDRDRFGCDALVTCASDASEI